MVMNEFGDADMTYVGLRVTESFWLLGIKKRIEALPG
jgi:hypothetical protein